MVTWLFQGSPKDFPAFDVYLRDYTEISWPVRQKKRWMRHQPRPTSLSVDLTLDDVRLTPEEGCVTRTSQRARIQVQNRHAARDSLWQGG